MRIALAQTNSTLGDFQANAGKILDFSRRAKEKRAHLVIFPELALCGYPPNDALESPDFVYQEEKHLKGLLASLPKDITVVFGAIISNPKLKAGGKPYQNVAVVARRGEKTRHVAKQLLPSYDVFDETRFFEPGTETITVRVPHAGRVAITICEDMWCAMEEHGARIYKKNPLAQIKTADLIVNISASPFSKGKLKRRLAAAKNHAQKSKTHFVYVNQIGGQDELLFDGRSFILDKKGRLVVQAVECEEDLLITDVASGRSEYRPTQSDEIEILRKSIVMGIRDFITKTGQKNIHLGLSGGIDSAVVAALCVDALGPARVQGLLLPGPYSSKGSVTDSIHLANNLGIKFHEVDINRLYQESLQAASLFSTSKTPDLMEQNLQARLRGLVLMAFSNAQNSMLVSTSNKCELATGYSTLYGDTNGGLLPIGDLVKAEVYALAALYNQGREIIPKDIISKPPSAELAPNQKDQDSLPPYDELDAAVIRLVEKKRSPKSDLEKWVMLKLHQSEFKRWQAPPILRVSDHSFGRGRRMPIAFGTRPDYKK